MKDELIEFRRFDNAGTAYIVKAHLESAGIPCILSGEDSLGFQQILTSKTGGIRLLIRRSDLRQAKELLDEGDAGGEDSGSV